ncbi:MAG: helix-turn-helix domain-containing protein [Synergistaceae bacterium]|nr:helix-turn-helix domain-containing protein [Synergistaceae bacterium]MBR1601847.1 helix-turn-helix domain-containing protein [Synergistaceae bacterium]MBR1601855.1 helix-turn-helix domain-containing protein [Synergistaceae bacterium]
MESSEFLTSSQLAARLNLRPSHVRALTRRGEFPKPLNFGRCRRWRVTDVERFIDSMSEAQDLQAAQEQATGN